MTTLHHAAAIGDEKALRTALTKDTVNQVDTMGATALIAGAVNAQPRAVALLLDAGADPRATDRTGATALHWSATYDQADIARALLDAGADPDATCALRQTLSIGARPAAPSPSRRSSSTPELTPSCVTRRACPRCHWRRPTGMPRWRTC